MIEGGSLAEILERRGDPMAFVPDVAWLAPLADIPDDAAAPLAMSGPHPRAVGSYGPECIAWARSEMGIVLRWWQQLAICRQLEHDEAGQLVWREVIESGSRRIGKSVRLRVVALWRIANAERIGETQLAMLVSKDLAVGKEIHRGAWRWAETRGWRVIRLGGGQEIEAPGESRWLLRADTAVYGYDVGYGQVDESWGVDPMAITDGLEPALLERLWAQLHLTSTAHVKATSLMRRRLTTALRDADPDVLILFWGAHPDADISLEETWRASSAYWSEARRQLIARKYATALAGEADPELDDPDPIRGWASQYLNVWPLLIGGGAGSLWPNWSSLAEAQPDAPVGALGVSADLDQLWLSLGAVLVGERHHLGALRRDPVADIEVFAAEAARVQSEHTCRVLIDPKGPASFAIPALQDAGLDLTYADLDDRVQACSDVDKAIKSGRAGHGDYPELNAAVDDATWRKVPTDRRVFGRNQGDISMLEAVAWAYGAVSQAPPKREFWGAVA